MARQADLRGPALEVELVALWADVTGAPPLSDDDFFHSGGDSIGAARLVALVRDRLGAAVELREFVADPTVAGLRRSVESAGPEEITAPAPVAEPPSCSLAQERFWFIDQTTANAAVNNVSWPLELSGPLDLEALQAALDEIVRRHEVLRTRFAAENGRTVQIVEPSAEVRLVVVDLSDRGDADATTLIEEFAGEPFDLGSAPLLRVQLIRLGDGRHILQPVFHHIASDDWSMGIFFRELGLLHRDYAEGREPQLPELPLQYGGYAEWQRGRLESGVLEHELEYWRRELDGAPAEIALPIDRPRPAVATLHGSSLRVPLDPGLVESLRTLGREEGATFFMTMLAAFDVLLHRYTGQDDVVVGTAVDNRGRPELESMIGLFTNPLVIRADLSGTPSFRELLGRIRARTLGAVANQNVPFSRLAAELGDHESGRHPLFQVFFELLRPGPATLEVPGLEARLVDVPARTSEFDLTLYLDERRGSVDALWAYSTDLFDGATVERLAAHFVRMLGSIVADPDLPVAELPLVGDAERRTVVEEWNETAGDVPAACLHELFEAQAGRTPELPAVVAAGEELSYAQLDTRANRIAHLLRSRGVRRSDVVGLCVDRSPDLLAAILGILKAGAAYLPLNPEHPAARLERQLADAGATALVTHERLAPDLPGFSGSTVRLDADALAEQPAAKLDSENSPEQVAYVLYTSGSTGEPKGVAVRHRNLVNYAAHMVRTLGDPGVEGWSFATVSSISTDLGNTAIFPALIGGGCVHLIAEAAAMDGAVLAEEFAARPVDVLKITPSHLRSLLDGAAEGKLAPRRALVLGGEALTWDLVERAARPGLRIVNHYGPTETTIGSLTFDVDPATPRGGTVPIGRPIANTRVYVLDARLQPVPVGVPGELYIGGAGVTAGYVGQPEATEERFVRDPFSPDPSSRLYRTGDLARYLADGAVEFLGRADAQVKIRGYRVEPAEVEAALVRQEGIGQAAVVPRGDGYDKMLVAYVVAETDAAVDAARHGLQETLPAHLVPSLFVRVDELPRTPSGKIDRRRLPDPVAPAVDEPAGDAGSAVEQAVCAVWAELLERDAIGVNDNFFEIGGHSLLTIRLIARLRSDFGVTVPLRDFVANPTVAWLAARIEPGAAAFPQELQAIDEPPPIEPHRRERPPCSFAQEQMWLVDQLTPSAAYNFSWPHRLRGPLDVEALERATAEVVRRHEAVRTRYVVENGELVQQIDPPEVFELSFVDLADEPDPEGAAQRLVDELTQRPFDLEREQPLRVQLVRLAPEDHILQIAVHHIAFDGWSKVVLYRELSALYNGFAAGRPSPLAAPPAQYGDFAEWQRARFTDELLADELGYWRKQLEGAPTAIDLPADRPRPPVASLRGARLRRPLPPELTKRLTELAAREGTTFFAGVLALLDVLLSRLTGQEDVVVGAPVDTRSRPEISDSLGIFLNTVVLRSDLSGAPTFRQLLTRVRDEIADAVSHQDLPFEQLVRELQPDRDLSRHPLFQVLLAVNPPEPSLEFTGVEAEEAPTEMTSARVDLFLLLEELPHGFDAIWEFSTDLFDAETIEAMQSHLLQLLQGVVSDPDRPIAELPLLSDEERRRVLEEWNDTASPVPAECVHELVAAQAAAAPDRVAVECKGTSLTYGELDARANRLARHLGTLGLEPDQLVAVCLERSADMVVALLGILKAGGVYVPVDPSFPVERQRLMLEDAGLWGVVTESALAERIPAEVLRVCLDRDSRAIGGQPDELPAVAASPDRAAYVIYTSGSTGRPKGVEVPHSALTNFLHAMRERPGLSQEDVLVAVTTLSFDIAGLELYLPLVCGARLVVAPQETTTDPARLRALLDESGATVMQATPATWRMLVDDGWPGRSGFKALCGGEALPAALADRLVELGLDLWNMYGPTETTIWSAVAHVTERGTPPGLGEPIANTTLYVLDGNGSPVPVGAPGELFIGGAGLARGYRGRPELTEERFVPNPFGAGRLYRTGDLVRRRRDGSLEFLGRLDDQVKVRGFRIELAEIETRLARHPGVRAAVAAAVGPPGESILAAYVVPEDGPVSASELRLLLESELPSYMVPSAFVSLGTLPLTPNGKVDRKALPPPDASLAAAETRYVAPRTELERTVAGIWSDLLECEQVGVEANFFALGGHSLLAARLMARLAGELDVRLPLRALFEEPTVAGLAARLEAARGEEAEPEFAPPPLVAAARVRRASFAQERFWLLDRLTPDSAAYNISLPLRLRGDLEVEALERALTEIVNRHDALRTRLAVEDGVPVQVIEPRGSFALELADLSTLPEPERARRAQQTVDELTEQPFDLERGPLTRARLVRLGDGDHVLQLVFSHVVFDAASKAVLFRELSSLYRAFVEGSPAALPELSVQYGDYAEWQRSWLQGGALERELDYWRSALDGMPPALELPTDHPRPAVSSLRGAWRRTAIAPELVESLRDLARAETSTLFMTLLAAFDVLLYRYTGETDVVVGSPVEGRDRPELEGAVGVFVNTLVLRNDLSGAPTFRELLSRVRRRTLDAVAHQELPFDRLVQELRPDRNLRSHPLFQVLLALNPPEPSLVLPALEVEEIAPEKHVARVDLALILEQRDDRLDAIWEYSTDLFEEATVERMQAHFASLLEAIVEDPDRPIDALPLDADAGLEPAAAPDGTPAACVHELFEAQAARTPDAVAVADGEATLSYAELNGAANRLARRLRTLGVGPEVPVALCLERSADVVVAVLAVLKAGGAYVPLDPDYPADRNAFTLADAQARVLVTKTALAERLPEHDATVLLLDTADLDEESAENLDPAAGPDNLAYVIYTSGSTGRPKGVQVEHRNVTRLFTATETWFGFGAEDTWTLAHSYAFDFSVWELWGALLYGGRLVVVPYWTTRSPEALARLVADEGVSVLNATPSLFVAMQQHLVELKGELSLRLVVFGGEALHPSLLRPWFDALGDGGPRLVNMYGITETTVHVTYRPITRDDVEQDSSPIGEPIPDLQLYVLDGALQPLPPGVPGELFVGGAGVARGYLAQPELTAERFVRTRFGPGPLYRTGDRARRLPDGGFEFLGRVDDQVKIRGFRVEPGEVQAALAEHPAVTAAAVVAREAEPGHAELAAYVVPDGERAGVVQRLLRLEREARLPREKQRELPNHLVVAHANAVETDFLYEQIFVRRSYLQHGIGLPQGACVFDVGANIGLFSVLAGRLAPGARVFAFEPVPPIFDLLRLNAELYGLDAQLFDCGLGAADGPATFTYFPRNTLLSGAYAQPDEAPAASDFTRPVRRISDVIAEHEVERIDLLKIDAERSEWGVIAGIDEADWPKIRQLVVEVHERGERVSGLVRLLEEKGFRVAVDEADDQALVYARRGEPMDSAPAATDTTSPGRLVADLKEFAKAKLPDYMVPSSITLLDALPLTASGKLDHRALPAPVRDGSAATQSPVTASELAVAELWQELLQVDHVGRGDDFFDLGGHSLLAAQLEILLRERLGAAVSLRTIFRASSLEELARELDAALDDPLAGLARTDHGPSIPVLPRRPDEPATLSYAQEQLWLVDQWDPNAPTYNVALPFEVRGPLDLDTLRGALDTVAKRHEALRTVIRLDGERPVPVVHASAPVEFDVVEVPGGEKSEQAEAIEELLHERACRPFDLAHDQLLRATVIRVADEHHVVLLETHHIAFDGVSERILFDELAALYAGRTPPPPPLQYGDFAAWQRRRLSGETLEGQIGFWQRYLAGAPDFIELPFDNRRPSGRRFRGASHRLELPADVVAGIRSLSRSEGATPYILLLGALSLLLYRTTGQDDILIGSPFANRSDPLFERVIGFFSNTLVFRARLGGNPSFREVIARLRESCLDAYTHHELPFEKIVDVVRPERRPGVNPLFQVNFRAREGRRPELALPGLSVTPLAVDVGLTRFDLALDLELRDASASGYFRYNRDTFEPATIARLADDFEKLLADALANPDRRLLDIGRTRERADALRA